MISHLWDLWCVWMLLLPILDCRWTLVAAAGTPPLELPKREDDDDCSFSAPWCRYNRSSQVSTGAVGYSRPSILTCLEAIAPRWPCAGPSECRRGSWGEPEEGGWCGWTSTWRWCWKWWGWCLVAEWSGFIARALTMLYDKGSCITV